MDMRGWGGRILARALILATLVGGAVGLDAPQAQAELGRFDGYEIRVIRPRYMTKRGRFELGGEGSIIMNESFIYTLLATGILDYHFSEMLALEVSGAYGFSIDKEDKRILQDEFQINTQILRTQYEFTGGVLWTPIYGKTQLSSGKVIYFDSFVTAQAGMTGIQYTYEQCVQSPDGKGNSKPPASSKGYPTVALGVGQQYFLSQDMGLRWDVRDYAFQYAKADGSCTPDVPQGNDLHNNITVQIGAATFF